MDKIGTTRTTNPGSKNEEKQLNNSTKHALTQQETALTWLRKKLFATLQVRQELYILSIASCIFKLKKRGHNIDTNKIIAGNKKIAQYVLLSGGNHE